MMLEVLILILFAPLFGGLSIAVMQYCQCRKFFNPIQPYLDIWHCLTSKGEVSKWNPNGAISLAAAILAIFILFNVNFNLDFIVFISFILISILFSQKYSDLNLKTEICNILSFIWVMSTLYIYSQNSIFETLLTLYSENIFPALLLFLIFIFLGVNMLTFDKLDFKKDVDSAFLYYSQLLCFNSLLSLSVLIVGNDSVWKFAGIFLAVACAAGIAKFLGHKFPNLSCVVIFLLSLFFGILALSSAI